MPPMTPRTPISSTAPKPAIPIGFPVSSAHERYRRSAAQRREVRRVVPEGPPAAPPGEEGGRRGLHGRPPDPDAGPRPRGGRRPRDPQRRRRGHRRRDPLARDLAAAAGDGGDHPHPPHG